MNILLWVLQIALALQSFAGGAYKLVKFEDIANMPTTQSLPRAAWSGLGVLEMVCAVLLIVPAATKWMPVLTPVGAAVLAVESLGLAVIFAQHSLKLAADNPFVYVAVGGVIAAFIAYGRYALAPTA